MGEEKKTCAHKEYTEGDRAHAIRLYKKGWGQLRIAQAIDCYPSTIHRWLKEAKVKMRPAPGYPDEFKQKVIAEYLERTDLSLLKVACKNKISSATLHRWLDATKTKTRPYRPRVIDRGAILRDIAAGLKKSEIARRNKCSESWVYQVQAGNG